MLLALLAVALLPQVATAKRAKPHVAHAVCHGKSKIKNKHCTTATTSLSSRSATLDPATSIDDPATTITDPGTVITDPGTVITDPGTVISDPGTVIAPPAPANPAQACRAEQQDPAFADTHDGKDFAHFYGTNPNLRNAFGKCVSSHAQAGDHGDDAVESDDQG